MTLLISGLWWFPPVLYYFLHALVDVTWKYHYKFVFDKNLFLFGFLRALEHTRETLKKTWKLNEHYNLDYQVILKNK